MQFKDVFVAILTATLFSSGAAQEVTVFQSGNDGYKSYRIPAIVKNNNNGELIAFAEGRVNDAGDFGHVNIVYKISKDGGKTWGSLKVAAENGKLQAGNSAPVFDFLDPQYPRGRLFLFYNTGNNTEWEVRNGNGIREAWYITSTDGANSWSKPVNITVQVSRPDQPQINPTYNFKEDWRAFANTPGHASQFDSGRYKGRIYVPANHSEGKPQEHAKDYFVQPYYTDDHGQTFHIAQKLDVPGSNETNGAQVSEAGEYYLNSRNQQGNVKERIISYSHNGGETWDRHFYDPNLPDPVNEGSVLSWRVGKKYLLAVSNDDSKTRRDNLTLRISKDQGKTWYFNKVLAKAPEDIKGDYSGYSDLVLLNKKTIGVLYEKGNYSKIVFVPVKF